VPERLDTITIALNRGNVTISWDTRETLLTRLQHVHETARIRATFDAVGATRPVQLNPGQKAALIKALEEWWEEGNGGMPIELAVLHDALRDDLHDAGERV
jgi:hypothetical protein